MMYTRIAIALFAVAALGLAVASSDQLVLLARVSFAGTALLAPLILVGVVAPGPRAIWLLPATAVALSTFLASVLGLIPTSYFSIRLDLILFATLIAVAISCRGDTRTT